MKDFINNTYAGVLGVGSVVFYILNIVQMIQETHSTLILAFKVGGAIYPLLGVLMGLFGVL